MENAVYERLTDLIRKLDESQHSFSKKIGVRQSRISMIIGRGSGVSSDMLLKIIKAYPDVDINWLLTGEGKMLKTGDINISGDGNISNVGINGDVAIGEKINADDLKKRIKELEDEVQQLRVDKTHLQDLVSLLKKNKDDS